MKVLVTGAAGFIGFFVTKRLLERGDEVVGLDNINDYYDQRLKFGRLAETGITQEKIEYGEFVQSTKYLKYRFVKLNLEDKEKLPELFKSEGFDKVCNLAAQAGVRYSLENPFAYIDSNIVGFVNLLECCRHYPVKKLVYASSSSVYGENTKIPFSENDRVDSPASLYAATKKSNELIARVYSKLFSIPNIGLRFFTVYGPWGRPDMAPVLFTKAIMNGTSIKVFNNGDLSRDFTYIDDIVEGVIRILEKELLDKKSSKVYNIGCGHPVELMRFISILEEIIGKKAQIEMLPMQKGDVYKTWADTTQFEQDFDYCPSVELKEGIRKFVEWYNQQ